MMMMMMMTTMMSVIVCSCWVIQHLHTTRVNSSTLQYNWQVLTQLGTVADSGLHNSQTDRQTDDVSSSSSSAAAVVVVVVTVVMVVVAVVVVEFTGHCTLLHTHNQHDIYVIHCLNIHLQFSRPHFQFTYCACQLWLNITRLDYCNALILLGVHINTETLKPCLERPTQLNRMSFSCDPVFICPYGVNIIYLLIKIHDVMYMENGDLS